MATIPLEDSFMDIIGKTQRGLKLADGDLSAQAGISVEDLARVKGGEASEPLLRKLAPALNLGANALVDSANKAWFPASVEVAGLKQFNTVYEDMTVNFYLAWDPQSKQAVVFDTGADCSPALQFAKANSLTINLILLTHTHVDHIVDLARLKAETGAPAWVGKNEKFADAQPFAEGKTFDVGALKIETRQTSGHAAGGVTYVISGLVRPVAVVGDALFAGSMGGGMISFAEALDTNRRKIFTLPDDTVLCPGHGPLTTVSEEKAHNPFYPEFQPH
jgi:glyoxylase-like metal-dependent hydrolase (beta-lactamase superfamily II)